jgi:ubiquinone/menaquinone biosynthesis C-methylase UbiE
MGTRDMFDGPAGAVAARVMARRNRDAEAEAVELLDPHATDRVLVVGFGPGVGLQLLMERVTSGSVGGVDPSAVMCRRAEARNHDAIRTGRLELVRGASDTLPWPDRDFDHAVAVNVLQMCEPFVSTASELARVLRPGARVVSLTHEWAIRRNARSIDDWLDTVGAVLRGQGFVDINRGRGRAESGTIVRVTASRPAAVP